MKIICFYLPQFHPIAENNAWWGPGFTEWHKVATARPRFRGHYQPHLPGELGFYDLRLEQTRHAQAELACAYGISGFCYYHFWFNGHMLLEQPFNAVLESGRPAFPFCLCWANENWTRRWDGGERQILIRQSYEDYDAAAHIDWLMRAFEDGRYIRVHGKPLLLIYNPSEIPDLRTTIDAWQAAGRQRGLSGLYLCGVQSVRNTLADAEMIAAGFDAVVDFLPRPDLRGGRVLGNLAAYLLPRAINRLLRTLNLDTRVPLLPVTNVFSYRRLMDNARRRLDGARTHHPCVIPSWDNSPRRREGADVYQNDDPAAYERWLSEALLSVQGKPKDEQLVFINAWNEWGEGCHLEPDCRHGRLFLEATRAAVAKAQTDTTPAISPESNPAELPVLVSRRRS
ncbi:MAG TPA: glycoside hydrolase family 99-like domain-containing protein [Nitrococcus sp.]|nr:glycoside hydrolase family 99-like domain-containing protein [Nitrococcus sp.]